MVLMGTLSDTHFGYAWGKDYGDDSFLVADFAIKQLIEKNASLVLLGGDIFESPVVKPEILGKTMKTLLPLVLTQRRCNVLEFKSERRPNFFDSFQFLGLPIISIWGTHERRPKGQLNPVQLLESANFLLTLHCESILLDIDGQRIGIHGMSGVPEQFAGDILTKWNPKPFSNAFNILMLHQNISPFIYTAKQDISLHLENLPKDFDIIIGGHLHNDLITSIPDSSSQLLFPGSTIITQMTKADMDQEKKIFLFDNNGTITSEPIPPVRENKLISIQIDDLSPSEAKEKIEKKINETLENNSFSRKPRIKTVVKGIAPEKFSPADYSFSNIVKDSSDKASINIDRKIESIQESMQIISPDDESKGKSIEERGLNIIQKHLSPKNVEFDMEFLYAQLISGEHTPVTLLDKILEKTQ